MTRLSTHAKTIRRRRGPLPILVAVLLVAPAANAYEGFGALSTGALGYPGGYETYHVTSLADSGPGTLRDAVSTHGRYVVFDVGGTIDLQSTLNIPYSYITIDGSTAPPPGITINAPSIRTCLEARNSVGPVHDVVIHHIRIVGAGGDGEGLDILELDGTKHEIYNVVLDHITAIAASDGVFDIWGEVRDVTVSNNLVIDTIKMCHLSKSDEIRERISFHHNVFARNNERQIRMRHHNELIDFVNNVVYGWGWFEGGAAGLSIDYNTGVSNEEYPKLNVENNVYHYVPGLHGDEDDAIVRTINGEIFFAGNEFPAGELDAYSTSARHAIPAYARVTTDPAARLCVTAVPGAGTVFATAGEESLLDEIESALGFCFSDGFESGDTGAWSATQP
jgi:pectate lyase